MQNTVRSIWALFVGIALLMLGNGLQGSLLAVRANIEGFPTNLIGFVMSTYYLGFLISSIVTPRFISGVGHIRVFAAFASLASTTILLHSLFPTPVSWMALRFVTGIAVAGLYVVCESWLNQVTTNEERGKVFSIYMMVVSAFMGLGQFILPLADPSGHVLFIVVSILVSLALVPISLSRAPAPTVLALERMSIGTLYAYSPLGVVGCFLIGIAQGAFISMSPLYATEIGLNPGEVALFLSLPFAAVLVVQFPLGALSDRVDRRRVITFVSVIAGVAAALMLEQSSEFMIYLLYGVFAACAMTLYGLTIAHANDNLPSELILPASAMLVLVFSIGSFGGPILAGLAMAAMGPSALFMLCAAVHVVIAVFAVYRMTRRGAVPASEKTGYAPIASRATGLAAATIAEAAMETYQENYEATLADDDEDAASTGETGGSEPQPNELPETGTETGQGGQPVDRP
ncbi:MAG: MFS transporter [Pseudomonadota bacterium]